jgi:protein involved in polysaccharide export with SLBB domain
MAAAAAVLAVLTGCETKSWIDPSELGRIEKTPLVVPILSKLLVGIEQDEIVAASARDVRAEDLAVPEVDFPLGAGDVLQIEINDLVQPGTQSVPIRRISPTGNITLPLVGELRLAGLSEFEAAEAINAAFRDGDFIQDARASVSVVQGVSRTFTAVGFVNQQGTYEIPKPDYRLWDALTAARGPSADQAVNYIYVIRNRSRAAVAPLPMPVEPAPADPGFDPLMPTSQSGGSGFFASFRQDAPVPTGPMMDESEPAAGPVVDDPLAPTNPGVADKVIEIEDAGAMPADPAMADPLAPVPLTPEELTASQAEPFAFASPNEPEDREVIRIPFEALLRRVELKYNIVIRPGDMIFVPSPPIGEYYMAGNVNRGGAYSLTARNITLQQAVASAGGLNQVAIPARTEIVRRIGNNHQVFVRVDLEKIAAGIEPDIYLKPNDLVRVGTNAGAPFLAALRNAFRFTYGFGFIYDRNFYDDGDNNN